MYVKKIAADKLVQRSPPPFLNTEKLVRRVVEAKITSFEWIIHPSSINAEEKIFLRLSLLTWLLWILNFWKKNRFSNFEFPLLSPSTFYIMRIRIVHDLIFLKNKIKVFKVNVLWNSTTVLIELRFPTKDIIKIFK